jgi:hypothetical protein
MKYQGAARLRPLSFVERIIAAARQIAECRLVCGLAIHQGL